MTNQPRHPAPPTLVNVRFRVSHTQAELVDAFSKDAPDIAKLPGLRWKIWSLDPAAREFAGVYLFDDPASAKRFVEGPVIAQLRASPDLGGVRAEVFPVLEGLSRVTRGPLEA